MAEARWGKKTQFASLVVALHSKAIMTLGSLQEAILIVAKLMM